MRQPLMIFAAGFGTRMRPLTDNLPKPLIQVGGQTLLDRAIGMGRDAGCSPIVVNTHYLGQHIADHVAGQDITISAEVGAILETGGGLRHALPLLGGGVVATLSPDVVWTGPNPLTALWAAWDDARMDALMMLVPLARATARKGGGDFALDAAGRIARRGDYVYGSAHLLRTDRLAGIEAEAFSLNVVWDRIIADGRAFGIIYPGGWCDVGAPETIPLAQALLDD